jgi:hypothetical protein
VKAPPPQKKQNNLDAAYLKARFFGAVRHCLPWDAEQRHRGKAWEGAPANILMPDALSNALVTSQPAKVYGDRGQIDPDKGVAELKGEVRNGKCLLCCIKCIVNLDKEFAKFGVFEVSIPTLPCLPVQPLVCCLD